MLPFLDPVRATIDPDARAFCALSGATERRQLSNFVKGVKALGLWSNMVCWPMRSAQNAGTGTTVYSLGGLGTYNGTMVNGPTWGASGINFTSGTQSVSYSAIPAASAISANGGYTSFSCLNFISRSSSSSNWWHLLNSGTNSIAGGQLYTDAGGENLRLASATNSTGQRFTNQNLSTGSVVGAGAKTLVGVLRTDSTGFSVLDTAAASSSVSTFGSSVPPPYLDGAGNGALFAAIGPSVSVSVNLAIVMFALKPITTLEAVSLRDLYKSTLGAGLSLP